MARADTARILAECIDDARAGHRTIDECLSAHPDLRDELEPLLTLAQSIVPPPIKVDPARKLQARHQFVEALHAESQRVAWWRGLWPLGAPARNARALAAMAAAALALTLGTGGGVALASQSAQPGDPLYGVKTAIERVEVAVALTDGGRAEAELRIAERRLDEVSRALDAQDEGAAVKAAAGYDAAVAQAQSLVARAQEQGADVSKALDRLTGNQKKQQDLLSRAGARAAEQAQDALETPDRKAQHGLARAIGQLERRGDVERRGQDREQKRDRERSAAPLDEATGTPTSTPTATPSATPATASPSPTRQDEVAATLGQLETALQSQVSTGAAESYRGLLAKLEAATSAARRGRLETALNQLAAFRNQLEAEHRTGRVGDGDYQVLLARYDEVVAALNARLASGDEQRGRTRGSGDALQTPAAAPTPTATPTKERGNSGGRGNDQLGSGKDRH